MQIGVVFQVVLEAAVSAVDSRNMRREVGWALSVLRCDIWSATGSAKSWLLQQRQQYEEMMRLMEGCRCARPDMVGAGRHEIGIGGLQQRG